MSNQPPPDPYGPQPSSGDQPGGQPQQPASGGGYPGQVPPYQAGGQPPAPPGYGPSPTGQPATNTLAIVSLICSLAGLFVWVSAPVGAILGHIARKQIRERGEQGEGMAMAGIIVGWVLTGIFVLCCIGYIGVIVFAVSQDPTI